ncbi:ABC transporter substrate-binding protein [Microbacterium sp. NPDC058389]|uniref:ABC transporter substrate-binding protein n=1 Tax=Microbacterium sp. NPDC058389 TaxID=3346475 RepID=UPI00366687DE
MALSRMRMGLTAATSLAVAALVLSGCSTAPAASDNTADGDGTLLSIFWKGSEKAGIDAAVAAYKESHPDVEIVVSTADVEQYQATLRTQLSAGTAADVVFVWPANGNPATISQIAPGGFLEDLTDRDWVENYPEAIRDLTSIDGKVYLMAPAVSSFGPWYNQTALAEVGVPAPTQWSEVLPFCEAAQDKGKVAYAIGAGTLNTNQNPLFGLVPDLVFNDTPDFDKQLTNGKTTFSENEGWVTAMDRYQQMNEAGCFNPDPTGSNQDDQNKLVASGQAVGMFGIGTQLAALKTLAPDEEFLITPFSGADGAKTHFLTASNAGGAAVNAGAKNKDLAFEFVDWLATPEGLAAYNDALAGTIPSIPNPSADMDENQKVMTEFLTDGRTVPYLDQRWPNPRIQQALFSAVQGMLAGTMQPADVLKAMDAEVE